jgi:3-methyladenine DNA glycosylase AlkC
MTEIKRKGARSIKEIDSEILNQLNRGEIETANLVEWLAVDQRILLQNLLHQQGRSKYFLPILETIDGLKKQTVNSVNEIIGIGILEQTNIWNDCDFLHTISTHNSDVVRCWAAYCIGKNPLINIKQKLEQIEPFAADRHFGVREISWLAVRKDIIQNLDESLRFLTTFATNEDENIRRFASEATRPRGVWCEHIEVLKKNPALGLLILEPLKSDDSKYVQNSVGNWLNDASKTQPEFVKALCKRWEIESNTKQTRYITNKALRTINKK